VVTQFNHLEGRVWEFISNTHARSPNCVISDIRKLVLKLKNV
jgi:hypothetical protein